MERLLEESSLLISRVSVDFQRYLMRRIHWDTQMLGIVGPRGVGKTTLLRQYAKLHLPKNKVLYVSADDIYFNDHSLLDIAREISQRDMHYLLIDEVHKYASWSQELKHIYDVYPDINIVFTGSSVLDILEGQADLSRRAVIYTMHGMSFREYLQLFHGIDAPVASVEDVLEHKYAIQGVTHPLPLFKEYLQRGYYPTGRQEEFFSLLSQVVNLTMEVDIPQYAHIPVSTGRKLEQLLNIIARSVPFKPSMQQLAGMIGVSRNHIADYMLYMEKAGMIAQLRTEKGGIRSLGKTDKIYLDNTNLAYLFGGNATDIGNIRETFFFNQIRLDHQATSHDKADFEVDDRFVFEVGGKSKQQQQIANLSNAYIVKDDIEIGYLNVLPLWAFGLLY